MPRLLTFEVTPAGTAKCGILPSTLRQAFRLPVSILNGNVVAGELVVELETTLVAPQAWDLEPSAPSHDQAMYNPMADPLAWTAPPGLMPGVPGVPEVCRLEILQDIMKTVLFEQTIPLSKILRCPPARENPARCLVYLKARRLASRTGHSIHQTHETHQQTALCTPLCVLPRCNSTH